MADGRTPDTQSPLVLNRRQKRSLRIADLGYFDTLQFQKEDEAGGYWISRLKVGETLLIFDEEGNPLDLYERLRTYAGRTSYECKIEVSAKRRLPARLIAFPEQIVLLARALNGHGDLSAVLEEILQGLDRCCIDKRKKRPNTFQLLQNPTLQETNFLASHAEEVP